MNYDYIIIGGGISGIKAGHLLNKKSNILLLEKNNRLGGRIYTIKNGKEYIELGAKWIRTSKKKQTIIHKTRRASNLVDYYTQLGFSKQQIEDINLKEAENYGEHLNKLGLSNLYFDEYEETMVKNSYYNKIHKLIDFTYILNTPVTKIRKFKNRLYIINDVYITKSIIFAIPLTILKNNFSHLLPIWKNKILKRMKMGKMISVALLFKTKWWKDDFEQRMLGNVVVINGGNVLYIHEFSTMSIHLHTDYKSILKNFFENAESPMHVICTDWNKYGGGWTYHKPGLKLSEIKKLRIPYKNIHLIGEYTSSTRWGTTDGAEKSADYLVDYMIS